MLLILAFKFKSFTCKFQEWSGWTGKRGTQSFCNREHFSDHLTKQVNFFLNKKEEKRTWKERRVYCLHNWSHNMLELLFNGSKQRESYSGDTDHNSTGILVELEETYIFCFALVIVLSMTESLMMLAQGLKCNLLFLLLCQYGALRSPILFNKCKREKNKHLLLHQAL